MNRLGRERSPYLLQHAENPVDWYAWSDEAFAKARADDKPIFLSVGYSTCHWCHVMEHESFESAAVAAVLNEHFVSIKVDREERPDVDRVYMAFVQATTGSGGWPMSVWLTPELKPFYGGTYFPPSSRWGRPGFVDILREITRVWRAERSRVAQSAEAVTTQLRSIERPSPAWTGPGREALAHTVQQFRESFDPRHGGFGDAPKFPRPSELLFLLREHARTADASARDMVLRTLRAMALGGMRDHIGGGFHRYSVDGAWRVPHFEKMLYDQAQLVTAFVEAAQVSGDPFYSEVAEDTLLYVMREMTDTAGGFYSAEDADSVPPETPAARKKEGAFYLWRAGELDALLGEDAAIVKLRFGIEPDGNAPHDPQQEFTGKNLLYVARSMDVVAQQTGRARDDVVRVLNDARLKMFEARLDRPRPQRDDKILTSWNGLMIGAFARVSRVIDAGDPYLQAARRAASFVRERMWSTDTGVLLRRYRDGHAEIDGYPSVLVRMKEEYDGAEPTASSVSVQNLMVLSHLVHEPQWTDRIERTLRYFGARLEKIGRAVPMMAAALSAYTAGLQQVVIAEGDGGDREIERALATQYRPFAVTLRVSPARRRALAGSLPFVAAMEPVNGATAAYVCQDFSCRQPVTTADALLQELGTMA